LAPIIGTAGLLLLERTPRKIKMNKLSLTYTVAAIVAAVSFAAIGLGVVN
jgi:hypothetical protein